MRTRTETAAPRRLRRRLWRVGLTSLLVLVLLVPGIALAGHQFGDVPSSNPFHDDIAALAASGVTAGCGGGNFCPKAFVTREQMAAFMNRLGALSASKSPVVNAAELDGLTASELQLEAISGGGVSLPTSLTPQIQWLTETITSTRPGRWLVTKSVHATVNCLNNGYRFYYLTIDGVPIRTSIVMKPPTDPGFSGQLSGLTDYSFAAGPHQITVAGQCASTGNYTSGSSHLSDSSSSVIVLPSSAEPDS